MIVSPRDISSASARTVFSVGSPAGTMIHTARGACSCLTSSSSTVAPRAPFATLAATASALRSNATTSCPPRTRRVVMFAPILPSPTIPSCIVVLRDGESSFGQTYENLKGTENRSRKPKLQAGGWVDVLVAGGRSWWLEIGVRFELQPLSSRLRQNDVI